VSHAGESAGCIIALADMPFVQADTVRAVAGAVAAGADIAAPFFQGRRGHPVGFAALYRDQLRGLDGDEGARFLLERDASRITRVAVNDPGVLQDVDVPRDLAD
jgi:molybdenum cofactor cytidylyltransferase